MTAGENGGEEGRARCSSAGVEPLLPEEEKQHLTAGERPTLNPSVRNLKMDTLW